MEDERPVIDDKEAVGSESSAAEERRASMAAAARRRDMRSDHGRDVAGGASRDAEATRRSGGAQSDYPGKGLHDSGLTRKQMAYQTVRAAMGSKSALVRLLMGGGVIGFIIAVALFFFSYVLVQASDNVTDFFDRRMGHTMNHRVAAGWVAVVDESRNIKGYRKSTANPLFDAYSNYKLDRLQADTGLKGVFDATGKLTTLVDAGGTRHDVTGAALRDQRSIIRTNLDKTYPKLGFFRRNIRARNLDKAFGIQRRFLEDKRQKLSEKIPIRQKLAEKLAARVSGADTGGGPSKAKEDSAKDKLKEAVNDNEGNAKGTSFKAISAGGASLVVQGCGLQGILKAFVTGVRVIREGQARRFALALATTAGQMRSRKSLDPKEVDELARSFSGFEKSGAYQRITGNPKAKLTGQHKYSLSGGNPLGKASETLTSNGVLNTACGLVNSTIGSVITTGLGAAQAFLAASTGGISAGLIQGGVVAVKSTAKSFAFGEVIKTVIGLATQAVTKPLVDINSSGEDKMNVAITGYDSYANDNARASGALRAGAKAVAALDRTIAVEERQDAESHGLAYLLFSPSYNQSALNRIATRLPASPQTLLASLGSAFGAITNPFSPRLVSSAGTLMVGSQTAYAENVSEEEDITGAEVPQYIVPDKLLDTYPSPPENEKWIVNYLWTNGQQMLYDGQRNPDGTMNEDSDSSGELTDKNNGHEDAYHDFVRKCLLSYTREEYEESDECKDQNSEVYNRFRVYRIDLLVGNYITSNNNSQNDQGAGEPCQAEDSSADKTTSKVFVVGDSIIQRADEAGGLGDKLAGSTIDASEGRSIKGRGTTGNKLSGLEAVRHGKDEINDASAVVVGLGTNDSGSLSTFKADVHDLIAAIHKARGSKSKIPIYWVNMTSTATGYTPSFAQKNRALEDLSKVKDFTFEIIDAASADIALDTDKIHPSIPGGAKDLATVIINGSGMARPPQAHAGCSPSVFGFNTIASVKIDPDSLFKPSSTVGCSPGTKDLGTQDGYSGGKKILIKICAIPGFPSGGEESHDQYGVTGAEGNVVVNSRVSRAVLAMLKAAKNDGVTLTAISAFRTMKHQEDLCPCDGINKAHPGYSNHQMGIAIDFDGLSSNPGPLVGNRTWDWLVKNAGDFGFQNYPHEAWHWSPTGH